ncbi:phosphoribosylaminoimidazolesuccinocarboxamide synthase [Candidatus Sumerlaeota bacterium]|nr:phosphoribosylaminoimidazolesuccinocarboxamide synthase [Candidatus Sumerlaeota bacterium]
MNRPLLSTEIPQLKLHRRGKVRDIYDLGEYFLMVTTDRISAFDCVFPNGIPGKGKLLTQLSGFWFEQMADIIPNHIVSLDPAPYVPEGVDVAQLNGRSMVVKKCEPVLVECVIRGYLEGSSVKDYQTSGQVGGVQLPAGLERTDPLPEPVYSPASKEEVGQHDINITYDDVVKLVGAEMADMLKSYSLKIYQRAHEYMKQHGIILADTKFEFGVLDGKLILIDELLTPDSSRYFEASSYGRGKESRSFDKQFVRDWANASGWDKTDPAPELPQDVVENTQRLYARIFEMITGRKPDFI